ncbi:hypothetical protein J6590_063202 [Homalodisca vitripennis]|nr:hypothetical protein J6590_063202 [Homalodisca vitripennis]
MHIRTLRTMSTLISIYFTTCTHDAKFVLLKTRVSVHVPLYVIDCDKQYDSIKLGPVDVRLEFEAKENFPANTAAYASYCTTPTWRTQCSLVRFLNEPDTIEATQYLTLKYELLYKVEGMRRLFARFRPTVRVLSDSYRDGHFKECAWARPDATCYKFSSNSSIYDVKDYDQIRVRFSSKYDSAFNSDEEEEEVDEETAPFLR